MELINAAKNGHFDLAFSLLQKGYKCDVRDKDNATPLYWSACHGHDTLCGILLQAGSDVNARVKWGSTPLHAASDRGHRNCVQVLLESGADINKQNSRGDTALHISAYRGFLDVTKTLLTSGADVTVRNEKSKTPEEEAMEGGHNDVAECIVQFVPGKRHHGHASSYRRPPENDDQLPPPYSVVAPAGSGLYGETIGEMTPVRHGKISNVCHSVGSCNTSSSDSREESYTGSSSGSDVLEDTFRDRYKRTGDNIQPAILRRSFSVGGSDVTNTKLGEQFIDSRTFSCGNVHAFHGQPVPFNDVNKTHSSVGELNEGFQRLWPSEASENLAFPMYMMPNSRIIHSVNTSNDRCLATESSDYSDDVTTKLMTSPSRYLMRPLRASTGSVRENDSYESTGEFVKRLQSQLIDAYKQTDKFTKENEGLKVKCSTILGRLTDTEQSCADKMRENEALKSLNEHNVKRIIELEKVLKELPTTSKCQQANSDGEGVVDFLKRLDRKLGESEQISIQNVLRDTVRERLLTAVCRPSLGEHDTEWVPGTDYVILGDGPIRTNDHSHDNQSLASLTFVIKQLKTGRRLLLKVYLQWRTRSDTSGLLIPRELDILSAMSSEPNIDKVVHRFVSSVDRFRKFIPDVITSSVRRRGMDLCRRAMFIVMPFHSLSWSSFEHFCCQSDSGLFSYGYFSSFLLHVLYMTSLALCRLHACGIVHGNISETSIVFDNRLRPIIVCLDDGRLSHVLQRCGGDNGSKEDAALRSSTLLGNELDIQEAYTTDVKRLGRMFKSLLLASRTSGFLRHVPQSNEGHVIERLGQLVRYMTESDQPDLELIKKRVGYLLFGPGTRKQQTPRDCDVHIRASLLRLLSENTPTQSVPSDQSSDFTPANIIESVRLLRPEVEADFLCSISAQELWDLQSRSGRDF